MNQIPSRLIVFEIANNHMGSVEHGLNIIDRFSDIANKYSCFSYAFKLQLRDLDTFIHPNFRGREDIHYVKRFSDTKLEIGDYKKLLDRIRTNGHKTMITPFDEKSVDEIEKLDVDILKIASCSFNDWPLLEKAVTATQPMIVSTAGGTLSQINQVVAFLLHRKKEFALMHCVADYPTTKPDRFNLSRIDIFRRKYPQIAIGFSTHESGGELDTVKIAIAKGATVFEKHIALQHPSHKVNGYSSMPEDIEKWLMTAQETLAYCGDTAVIDNIDGNELATLKLLKRGMFARRNIQAGEQINQDNVYLAFPCEENQFVANDLSKYNVFTATENISVDGGIFESNAKVHHLRGKVVQIVKNCQDILKAAKIFIPGDIDLEISHHYGLEKFDEFGLVLLTVVNRQYCKKLLICAPNQTHPEQYHKKKEETFHVLYGDIDLYLNGQKRALKSGDVVTIEPRVKHSFKSAGGAVVEEISSTHFKEDSFYVDESITQNTNRKTLITDWLDYSPNA